MTAIAVAPVADLASDLERLADLFISGERDEVRTCLKLIDLCPHLFGEDLWLAWEDYVTAVRLREDIGTGRLDWTAVNEYLLGPDKTEMAIQEAAERADDALRVLLAAGEPRREAGV